MKERRGERRATSGERRAESGERRAKMRRGGKEESEEERVCAVAHSGNRGGSPVALAGVVCRAVQQIAVRDDCALPGHSRSGCTGSCNTPRLVC